MDRGENSRPISHYESGFVDHDMGRRHVNFLERFPTTAGLQDLGSG
jgi:hypothetical protein